jgi:uncharacterized protein YbcI
MKSVDMADEGPRPSGEVLAAISNRIVAILRERYGRGPTRAKTYVLDDIVVVIMRNGFTAMESTMMEGGHPESVIELRREFQRLIADRYRDAIEEITGREVVAFLSQAHIEPDVTLEAFVLDRPLGSFGAMELIDPGADDGDGDGDGDETG